VNRSACPLRYADIIPALLFVALLSNTVGRTAHRRLLGLSACAIIPLSTYLDIGLLACMTLVSVGTIFGPSLLMGSLPTQTSPSLRSLIKWNTITSIAIFSFLHALPILIEWLVARFDHHQEKPSTTLSVLTPWLERTQGVLSVFAPALWIGQFLGVSISRLYRIDVANSRRKNVLKELRPDRKPPYLADHGEAPRRSEEVDRELRTGTQAIRILSPPEIMRSEEAFKQLVYPPWYSGTAYLFLLVVLAFGMPTLNSLSPLLRRIKVCTSHHISRILITERQFTIDRPTSREGRAKSLRSLRGSRATWSVS
jgi:hypothetical protein